MFTFEMITLSQDVYWNSKHNISPINKMNLQEGNFLKQNWIVLCHEMLGGMWLKTLIPK